MIGVFYSISLPNIYVSKAILAPVNSASSISSSIRSYSGIAGLAGINLPSESDESNTLQAIQKLSSLSFFEDNILTNIFLPDLMAIDSWNSSTNTLVYDENIFKDSTNAWVREYSYPRKQIPSAQESFEVFINNHFNISGDKSTGFITLSIRHQSPFIAKQWAELIINEVNNFYRQKDKLESEKAVIFLNKQISMTGLSEIKQVIAELLQEETQKLTLIEANEFYVFDYIDPPAVMEKKSEPKRSLIFLISLFIGGLVSIVFVLIRYFFMRPKDS